MTQRIWNVSSVCSFVSATSLSTNMTCLVLSSLLASRIKSDLLSFKTDKRSTFIGRIRSESNLWDCVRRCCAAVKLTAAHFFILRLSCLGSTHVRLCVRSWRGAYVEWVFDQFGPEWCTKFCVQRFSVVCLFVFSSEDLYCKAGG